MSILVDEKTRVVVQGITGREGTFHTRQMLDYGTAISISFLNLPKKFFG